MTTNKPITIHTEGKIDIHHQQRNLNRALDRINKDNNINQENKKLILQFINDCMLGKTVIGKRKKKIGPATCLKYLNALPKLCYRIGKSFDDITQEDMETFISDLEYDRLLSFKGIPFADETKVGIKKAIKKFWKWKNGNKNYPELVEWIDTYIAPKDIPALRRREIEKIIDNSSNSRNKALLMLLFDSGARIEELLNVRLKKEHIFWKEKIGCYMIRLEFSKTKPRTISIPLSTKYLKEWLEEHPAKHNSQAQLFPMTYGNVRMFVSRIGKRVLSKRVTPHMFRHSSASFYANKLNRYQLCYRYGWAMSSNEVDRYLDREGVFDESTAELVNTDEITKAKSENIILREELSLIKESHSELEVKFEKLMTETDNSTQSNHLMNLLMNMTKQQKEMAETLQNLTGKKFNLVLPSNHISKT